MDLFYSTMKCIGLLGLLIMQLIWTYDLCKNDYGSDKNEKAFLKLMVSSIWIHLMCHHY
jgi:hypothetical protein